MSDIPTTREIEALESSAFQRARSEKAEAELAALTTADAKRTVALWTMVARFSDDQCSCDGSMAYAELALAMCNSGAIKAARKTLEEADA